MPSVAIQKSHSTLKDIFVLISKESREQFELFQSVVAKLDERDFNVIEKHIDKIVQYVNQNDYSVHQYDNTIVVES